MLLSVKGTVDVIWRPPVSKVTYPVDKGTQCYLYYETEPFYLLTFYGDFLFSNQEFSTAVSLLKSLADLCSRDEKKKEFKGTM